MKDHLQLIAAFAVILAMIPLISYAAKHTAPDSGGVGILYEQSGEVVNVSLKDYIIGAVFAQMPADFDEQALRAQAVLASTYIKRRAAAENTSPTKELKGALISDDRSEYQAYFTEEEARSVYADEYEQAYERISSAAEYAQNLCLCYNDQPIIVAFHGISFGYTESAEDMWGEAVPYLISVESLSDADMAECESGCELTADEFLEAVKDLCAAERLDADMLAENMSVSQKTEHGTILEMRIGDNVYPAAELCEALGLASQHFELRWNGKVFEIKVHGCGHLVGMSQYGAQNMAEKGASCEDILLHYFPETTLEKR